MPSRTCGIVKEGRQSEFKIDKQTEPEAKTFGWKIGGVNMPTHPQVKNSLT